MKQNDALGFLGLLYPSRQIIIGEELWKDLDKVTLVVVASDISSGESVRHLEKLKRMHKPLYSFFTAEELGRALGHSKVNFIGILNKKASMNFLLKAKKGEQDEEAATNV